MEDNYNKGKAFNENLLDKVYLPDVDRKNFINGKAFKLLKENNNDTTVLEGYAEKSKEPLKFEDFNTYQDKEEWIAKHAGPEEQKQFFSALGDFVLDLVTVQATTSVMPRPHLRFCVRSQFGSHRCSFRRA